MRRNFLKAGALAGVGLGLSDYFSLAHAGVPKGKATSAKSDDERSQGQTFFADPDGDDSAAGTSAAEAWRTVA